MVLGARRASDAFLPSSDEFGGNFAFLDSTELFIHHSIMPAAVLADSDDDGDDSAEFECEDTMASSRGSRAGAAEGDGGGLDGADERSTGSMGNASMPWINVP